MDEIVEKIAGIGVPALMFFVAISMTGLTGAAAYTAALALLGPGGMIGGVMTLLLAGAISSALAKYGFQALFTAIIRKMVSQGESKASIEAKIRRGFYTQGLKAKALEALAKC